MRYNKNKLKNIEYSIRFFKDILTLQEDKLRGLSSIYKPSGYYTGISYNDYDNIQTSKRESCIFEVARIIKDTKLEIKKLKDIICLYEKEKRDIKNYIVEVKNIKSYDMTIKEKINQLLKLNISIKDISEILECSYRYITKVKGEFDDS